jgi:cold shock CspA family protein
VDSGTIKFFDARKNNFGFIIPDKAGAPVFLHGNVVSAAGLTDELPDGQRVRYRVEPDRNGRPRATYVELGEPFADATPGYGRPID